MALHRSARSWTCLALSTLFLGLATADPSIPIAYCASINTSPNNANESNWQSEGLCSEFCQSSYALAIVQDKNCWCSNYVPDTGDQVNTGNCETSCPGFPNDYCGGDGLYGYLALNLSPSGTTGGGSSQKTSSSSTAGETSASRSSKLDTTSGSSSTGTPTPSLQTVTAGGTVKTVTITPTPTATDSANSANIAATSSSSGLSAGAAAGIAVGVIAIVGIAVGFFIWMWCRKRRQNGENGPLDAHSQRASSSGMTGTPRTGGGMSENRFATGPDGQYAAAENWDGNGLNGKRRSTLMPVDPRLDPFARGMYNSPNKSRESVNSLQDNQDYSRRVHEPGRVLRATNPDPEVE